MYILVPCEQSQEEKNYTTETIHTYILLVLHAHTLALFKKKLCIFVYQTVSCVTSRINISSSFTIPFLTENKKKITLLIIFMNIYSVCLQFA